MEKYIVSNNSEILYNIEGSKITYYMSIFIEFLTKIKDEKNNLINDFNQLETNEKFNKIITNSSNIKNTNCLRLELNKKTKPFVEKLLSMDIGYMIEKFTKNEFLFFLNKDLGSKKYIYLNDNEIKNVVNEYKVLVEFLKSLEGCMIDSYYKRSVLKFLPNLRKTIKNFEKNNFKYQQLNKNNFDNNLFVIIKENGFVTQDYQNKDVLEKAMFFSSHEEANQYIKKNYKNKDFTIAKFSLKFEEFVKKDITTPIVDEIISRNEKYNLENLVKNKIDNEKDLNLAYKQEIKKKNKI